MDLSLRLKIAPERRLAMTFALSQALEILLMPQIELAQWLNQEIEKNPLLQEITASKKPFHSEDLPSPISLYDHLMSQIRESFSDSADRRIGEALIESLDEKGFLASPVEELAHSLQIPLERLLPILTTLQTFDPPGIFAKNLQDSLLLQLKMEGETHAISFQLIRDCFDDLLYGRYAAIRKKMGPIDLTEAIQKLARLRLRPTEVFKKEVVPMAIADLRIEKTSNGWIVEVSEEDLPKFQINPEYKSLTPETAEEKESLRNWSTAGKWLIRSLKRRRQILVQVGILLVRKQSSFLSLKGNLRSLTLQDLATELDLHESTLSRALSGKYAETPRGLIPLRSLLTTSPEKGEVKEVLVQLITQEDKQNPLTDDELAAALAAKGYKLARRTIVKYRKELKIAPSNVRKNLFTK